MNAPRPDLTAPLDTPAFVAWAASRTVEDHLSNAQQIVELALYEIARVENEHALTPCNCGTSSCLSCSSTVTYFLGIRQRLAAIAGLLAEPMHPHVEMLLKANTYDVQTVHYELTVEDIQNRNDSGFFTRADRQVTTAPSGVVSHDGADGSSPPYPDAATAAESAGAAHTATSAAELWNDDRGTMTDVVAFGRRAIELLQKFGQPVSAEIVAAVTLAEETLAALPTDQLAVAGHQAEAKRTGALAPDDGRGVKWCVRCAMPESPVFQFCTTFPSYCVNCCNALELHRLGPDDRAGGDE